MADTIDGHLEERACLPFDRFPLGAGRDIMRQTQKLKQTQGLRVSLVDLTSACNTPAPEGKCQNRESSVAYLTLGPRSRLGPKPSVRYKSNTRLIELLVFLSLRHLLATEPNWEANV
jgi:predicted small secreted protein